MAEAVTIAVQTRDPAKNQGTGSRVARRLRAQGRVPAIVYGHKQAPTPISLSREEVLLLLKKGSHLTQLRGEGLDEMALVRDVQWDHLGKEVLHLDFFRVSAQETITTEVPLELHGTAPGLAEGGLIAQPVHTLAITCKATELPDSIRIEVGELRLDGMIHVKDLTLPPGVTAAIDPDLVLVHCVPKSAVAATTPAEGEGLTQPEVIGKEGKKEEE